MESTFVSAFNTLKSTMLTVTAKTAQAIMEIASNELNYYVIGILVLAVITMVLYHFVISLLKHIAPEKFTSMTQIFFTRLVWNILSQFQV